MAKAKGNPHYEPNTNGNAARSGSGVGESRGWRKARTIFWGELSPDTIGRVVSRVCDAGRGLVLGRTTDGGALSITILDGEHRVREYIATVEDFDLFATWVADSM